MTKKYGMFNENGLMIQSINDLVGSVMPEPWVEIPEEIEVPGLPVGRSESGEFVVSPSFDYVFNKTTGQWSPDIERKKRDLLILVSSFSQVNDVADIEYQGNTYNADETAQANLLLWQTQLAVGATLPEGFTWRDRANVDQPANAAFINGLALALATRKTNNYKVLWQHKAAIQAITTVEEINSYNPRANWTIQLPVAAIQSQFQPFKLN
jgi:hypothetical protein